MAVCCVYGAFVCSLFFRHYSRMPSFDGLSRFTAPHDSTLYQEFDSKSGRLITCQVQGMSCTSCAAAVKEKLLGLTGVKLAHVDFLSGLTNIVLMKNVFRPPDVLSAISDLGYTAQPRPSGSAHVANAGDSDWNWRSVSWSLLFVIPILIIESAPEVYLEPRTRQLSILVLAAFVQIAFGLPFYRNTTAAIRNNGLRHLPMDVLITCSTTTAYVTSVYFFLQQQTTTYAATSASLIVVVSLGKYLEARFKRVSMSAMSAFANLLPSEALLVGTRKPVPVHSLKAGDRVVIKPGERFPCDGKLPILLGDARELQFEVDESLHTGEQHPVLKHAGDICLAGTINSSPRDVLLDVIHEGQNRLNEILDAIVQGQHYKSSLQSYVDEAAQYIVPGVLLCAIIAFLTWLPQSLDKAVGFLTATLVVACPCALGVSVPLAVMIGSASGAAHGIIIKRGGQTYHKLARATMVVFDKTGTLTSGQIRLARSKIRGDWDEAVCWQLINRAERDSCHWASSIISKHVDSRFGAVCQPKIRQQHETPGRGVSAMIDGIPILVGNESHLREAAVTGLDSMEDDIAQLPPSETCVVVALNGRYAGYMSFVDSLREEAIPAIAALKSRGYKVYMMTGDRPSVSHSLATDLNISHCLSRLTPLSKVAEIQKLRAIGEVVIMVGDGINDAAALAAADIGIAIQSAHSVALASSDIVLLRPSLLGVLTALTLGRSVYATMQANVLWACVYNVVLVPLAMGFGARWGVTIPPTMSGTLMMMSSLGVTYNSIRLRGKLKSALAT